ncbi:MAG: ROK family protein [Ktedonobacteraceae bacterium]|nr:ROK family protein [Ktedonobacteraceae bacterium]
MYIGIDIGGTNTRIGLFPSLEQPDFTPMARFSTSLQYGRQLTLLRDALRDVEGCHGIGISVGGRVTKDGQAVSVAHNLRDYEGKPFIRDLAALVGCPAETLRLAHDPVCGLLAEQKFGSLRGSDRCVYLTLSTGTGAAFHLRSAAASITTSIEFGHQLLDGNERECICGQVGCLETFTGGRQLEMRLGHSIAQISDQAFWNTFCDKLALGLVNLVQLTRVEVVAISGAIALNNVFFLPLLQEKVAARLRGFTLAVMSAALGEDAPLIGAVTLLAMPDGAIAH